MKLSGWGRYPVIDSVRLAVNKSKDLYTHLRSKSPLIAYGNGRSYGDSALAEYHLPMRNLNRFLDFDPEDGLLRCESGVLLSDIIETFLPRGWFPEITPGTKQVTVGGAIAADVHGKNHHKKGCFSECVKAIKLLLPGGKVYRCSHNENATLFRATCGGMGLTGVILEATIQLKPVRSQWVDQITIKTSNLKETFEKFERYSQVPYSVAWTDALAKGDKLGRSLFIAGNFKNDGDLSYKLPKNLTIPFDFPSFILNNKTAKLFNIFYYWKAKSNFSRQTVGIDSFFYPLDGIQNWNRIYGRNGFTQYQFILPKSNSFEGMEIILDRISKSGFGSFLSVLKLHGEENNNFLSFPMEGYSLALDFKMQSGLMDFLKELNNIVIKYGGRIYLAKDATMDQQTFEAGYPQVNEFRDLRKELGLNETLNSIQSGRLGL
jgi:FAD/FMN-containing dehydrogenase